MHAIQLRIIIDAYFTTLEDTTPGLRQLTQHLGLFHLSSIA